MYRKYPAVIPAAEWALRIVSIMDDQDLVCIFLFDIEMRSSINQGVAVCVTSLVMALAEDHPEAYALCYLKAVDRMNRVSDIFFYCFVF